jgi:CRISPR-associated Csx2 family protein
VSSLKAISFLGKGKYETVTYCWQGRECQTHLFPEALARIFEPEKVLVFVTPSARDYRPPKGEQCACCDQILSEPEEEKTYCDVLRERLGDRVEFVEIPEGRSEQELWEIFDRVASVVSEKETILLDITHAFRSIPMVVFAVAAYLRRTKSVTFTGLLRHGMETTERPSLT